jgi:hypothetical protein
MPLCRSNFLKGAAVALLVGWCMTAHAFDPVADMSMLYSAQVDRRLSVPAGEARHYGRLAEEALAKAGMSPAGPEYLVLVDRDPNIFSTDRWRVAVGGRFAGVYRPDRQLRPL